MIVLAALIGVLVLLGSLLAIAEASISRLSRARAMALREEKRRNAGLLVEIESDPPRYLNSIYLAVLVCQNGSAILTALLADRLFGDLGVTLVSVAFTLGYFVVVEAMAKTFGILHADRAALAMAPLVWGLGRLLQLPTRALIGLANILLPGKGIKQGPFVSADEIRSLAEVGHEEGAIAEQEKELIHSIFEFGDTLVREVMVPRPDVIAVEVKSGLDRVQDVMLQRGHSRIPVYAGDLDRVEGWLHAKDVLRALRAGRADAPLAQLLRPVEFVPETTKAARLLHDMQVRRFHLAMVTDEYGSVSGLVTLEDLLEELVGEIEDEDDRGQSRVEKIGPDVYRVDGLLPVAELNDLLEVELPQDEWDTVAGLMLGLLGSIPAEGQEVRFGRVRFRAEKVHKRRILRVLVTREPAPPEDAAADSSAT
jgi:CBS domain containing-hemolysin-like protein